MWMTWMVFFLLFFHVIWHALIYRRNWFSTSLYSNLLNIPVSKTNLLSFCFSFVQACPKLIDRFKEREENVKVRPDQLTGEIWALHLNPHLSLL
jgi:hypothetical protein